MFNKLKIIIKKRKEIKTNKWDNINCFKLNKTICNLRTGIGEEFLLQITLLNTGTINISILELNKR